MLLSCHSWTPFAIKIIREIQLRNNNFFVLIYGFIIGGSLYTGQAALPHKNIHLIRSRISITGIGKNSGRFRSIVKHLERLLEEKKNKVRRGCNGQNVVVQKPDNRYNIEKKVRKCRY